MLIPGTGLSGPMKCCFDHSPGLSTHLRNDNARPKCIMKRPYSTHFSYEETLADFEVMLDFSSTHIFLKRLELDSKFSRRILARPKTLRKTLAGPKVGAGIKLDPMFAKTIT